MSVVASDMATRLDTAIGNLIRKARAGGADTCEVLAQVTRSAVQHVPTVDHAGITLVEEGDVVRSLAATDGHALVVDNIQRRQLAGPGYDSATGLGLTIIDDLCHEPRWPAVAEQAAASTPIRSIIAFAVANDDNVDAALSFYSDTPAVFDAETEALGAVYAGHIARLLTSGVNRPHFSGSPRRDVVATGKALLMKRFDIDPAAALSVLIRLSNECHESLEQTVLRLVGLRPVTNPRPPSEPSPLDGRRRDRYRIWHEGAA